MPGRKEPLITEEFYHIYSRSIAKFKIFRNNTEYLRMLNLIKFYRYKTNMKFSVYAKLKKKQAFEIINQRNPIVNIIAYCLMPTHIHLILKQLTNNGISYFMSNILNGYTRFFNTKNKRKGPLWEGRFKNVQITSQEQLLHLTRYIHLNPTTASLVDSPKKWLYSSYLEFLGKSDRNISDYKGIINMSSKDYQDFTESYINEQKELAKIKKLVLEESPDVY